MNKKLVSIIVFVTLMAMLFYYVSRDNKSNVKISNPDSEITIKKDSVDSLRFKEKEVNSKWLKFKTKSERSLTELENLLDELPRELINLEKEEKRIQEKKLKELRLKLKELRERLANRSKDLIAYGNQTKTSQRTFQKEFRNDIKLIEKTLDTIKKTKSWQIPTKRNEK
jgi:hypothetical protein